MLDLVFKNNTSDKSPGDRFFSEILSTGIKEVRIKDKNVEMSLNLVGEVKIKKLNKQYRGKNEVTDVLSFPLEESRFKKYGILPLGDIFICLPFAVKEAERQNISLKKELVRLTIHGFLHLLGYDHEKSISDKKKMFDLENKILEKWQDHI
ncbi:MAG: rRNA maturation RNase YbeY [Candidatus Yanofskybacteria bacterium RIFCSPLOWO2_01_FULL_41_34]|uniref:Endoribonuclease YbeY n=1 Tax=Candidatus Yanofskybacteria bacterium RIFCSPHIGHO2_01_FULL_41_26 TaxID=1802661 RepID=A0A1F8EDM1_9BACT|nr:MAG: rRNA maturation RNase YbeY [Candidatus Yanofskybacteria bacterium RIFCSPHIGHO2_01_FULL_41_26]OGN22397.1 MAG: rRNA maturation RNase YbeY [Candidatus Yanofskybacteria bacterium RIFCSPLOWO2_01_FULL_41_34]